MITARQAIGLVVSMVICFGAAGLGSLFTRPSIENWYLALHKPPWTPPNWVFGPVWTVLYLGMAIAAWLVWRKAGVSGGKLALTLFAIQLVLNVCWSAIFFAAHMPGYAFAEIVLLWLLILATVGAFWSVSRAAGWMMVPYLIWVAFAGVLNYAIWRLNA